MRTGEAKFGLVAPSGWRNLRARLRIVPAPALSNATAKESTIALDVSLLQWKNAPRFRKSEVVELNDPARQREILSSYAPPKSRVTQAHPAPPPDEWRPPPVKARAADRPRGAAAEMKLASDLLGARLLDRSKQAVGRMSDLLIDLNGKKAAFAVVSESKLLKSKENFVTPLRALRLVGEGQLMIDAGDPAFEQARPFSEEAWQALGGRNGTTIYRVTE